MNVPPDGSVAPPCIVPPYVLMVFIVESYWPLKTVHRNELRPLTYAPIAHNELTLPIEVVHKRGVSRACACLYHPATTKAQTE